MVKIVWVNSLGDDALDLPFHREHLANVEFVRESRHFSVEPPLAAMEPAGRRREEEGGRRRREEEEAG